MLASGDPETHSATDPQARAHARRQMSETRVAPRLLADDDAVAKRRTSGPTFNELLAQEASSDIGEHEPSFKEVDNVGRGLVLVSDSISPERAHELVLAGAAVAWDDCGSRGRAGVRVVWFDDADVARMAASGPPQLRRKKNHRDANLMEYRREDGRPVVIAEMSVRWADLMY